MSVALYDQMVAEKIKGWVIDPQMTVYDPDETTRLFRETADLNKDKPIQLPLIAISRDRDIDIKMLAKRPMSYMGQTFNANSTTADHLNAIPIGIGYQLDIYTRYKAEADEYVRNFIFNIINHPMMELLIPYNGSQLSYISYMQLTSPVSDNSDISERLIPGQFTRMTIKFRLEDAQLFSYNFQTIPKIQVVEIEPKLVVKLDGIKYEGEVEETIRIDLRDPRGSNKNKNKKVSVKISE